MPKTPDLPVDLERDDLRRTANTPSEFHDLVFRGFTVADGAAVADVHPDDLTPAQKAARTRAANAAGQGGDATE